MMSCLLKVHLEYYIVKEKSVTKIEISTMTLRHTEF
jgi:hypothetical protein